MSVCIYIFIYIYTYIHKYIQIQISFIFILIYIYTYVSIYLHISILMYICISISIFLCMCICIYVQICVWVCIQNGINMGEPIRTRKGKMAGRVEHDARLGRVVQVKKRGGGKSAHLSSAGKKSSLTFMKRNRKRKRTKRTGAKRRHIAGRAYDTGRGGSEATSKWQ